MSLRDLRRHAGEFVMVGFDGQSVPQELRTLTREFDLAGAVLFGRNVAEPAQVADLAYEIRCVSETPLWVAVDQEGGRVARLGSPFTVWPPMATLGRARAPALVQRFAEALARELRAVGITFDFAPVLDVATNPRNPVIGDRALSDVAAVVAEYGPMIIAALQAGGIAACGKHFPGHGDTDVDSHVDLPVLEHPIDRLRAVEFVPFEAAVAADVASMMVAHLLLPAVDEEHPASLSARTIGQHLRTEIGFDGLVLSDDLEMKAVSTRQAVDRAAVLAVGAGCDIVLSCGPDQSVHARIIEAIIYAAERGELSFAQLDRARSRQRRAKARFLAGPPPRPLSAAALSERIGTAAHASIAEAMAAFA